MLDALNVLLAVLLFPPHLPPSLSGCPGESAALDIDVDLAGVGEVVDAWPCLLVPSPLSSFLLLFLLLFDKVSVMPVLASRMPCHLGDALRTP